MTRRTTYRPQLQQLEDRLTPAGNVTASLSGTLAAGATRFFWVRVQVK